MRGKMNLNRKKFVLPLAIFIIYWFTILFFHLFSPTIPLTSTQSKLHTKTPPRIAYFITASADDGVMMERILLAIYHPLNVYLLHLDTEATPMERRILFDFIDSHEVFSKVGNVKMIMKSNRISEDGPTRIANVLNGAARLLKEGGEWDWFITLDASDYPLVTQDDLLYVLSQMPRDLNFINCTSHLSWKKEGGRSGVVIIDRDLYTHGKGILQLPEKRGAPTVFDLFIGSPSIGLTRSFIEYCIWGWDNLPRSVLMYHANSVTSSESYFQTVICNSPGFHNTTINTDLHFNTWDIPNDTSGYMTMDDCSSLQKSNAPFARKFEEIISEHVLDWIDQSLLSRDVPDMFVPGGWCAGLEQVSPNHKAFSSSDPCLKIGNVTNLIPGYGAQRLQHFFNRLVYNRNLSSPQCAPTSSTK